MCLVDMCLRRELGKFVFMDSKRDLAVTGHEGWECSFSVNCNRDRDTHALHCVLTGIGSRCNLRRFATLGVAVLFQGPLLGFGSGSGARSETVALL